MRPLKLFCAKLPEIDYFSFLMDETEIVFIERPRSGGRWLVLDFIPQLEG